MAQGRFVLVKIGFAGNEHCFLAPPSAIKHLANLIPLKPKYSIIEHRAKYIITDGIASPVHVTFEPLQDLCENEQEFVKQFDAAKEKQRQADERKRLHDEVLAMDRQASKEQ